MSSESEYSKIVELDSILGKFSNFGKYHALCNVLYFIGNCVNTSFINYIFTATEINYRCKDGSNSTCGNNTQVCTEWEYEDPHSFVAEYDLACQDWKRTLVGTVHGFGYMVGLFLVGLISDRLGRKPALIITGISSGVIGIIKSFSPSYWLFIALEFLEAAAGNSFSPLYMWAVEIVATEKRVVFVFIGIMGFPIGNAFVAAIAWWFQYWRTYLRVIYAPVFILFFYKCLLDESPRWLISKGRTEEAKKILTKAAKMNNILLNNKDLENLNIKEEEEIIFLKVLRDTLVSKKLLKRFVICLIWWITSTFVNHGLLINSVSLQGNKYINFAVVSLIDIPSALFSVILLKYFSRKITLIISFLIAALLCICQPFVPLGLLWLSTSMYIFGKLFSSCFFDTTYLFTSELFPTYTRNSMHSLCSSLGRIGSMIAPQTPLLMKYWQGMPPMVFGGMALFAGLLTFFVPDTGNTVLPDTIKEAEALENSIKGGKTVKDNIFEAKIQRGNTQHNIVLDNINTDIKMMSRL